MTEQDTNVQGDCLNMSECGIYENGTSIVALRHSAGFQGRSHRNTRQHYASAVADLGATVAIGKHRRQWTTVRRA